MARIPRYRVWDGELLHTVSGLDWVKGGIQWHGPGVGSGWIKVDKHCWHSGEAPNEDQLLEVVEV